MQTGVHFLFWSFVAFASYAWAQGSVEGKGRPAVIEAEISKTGRFALLDGNNDGWDDLWAHLFPEIDFGRPGDDSDGDGKTNYEEMLDFSDPFQMSRPVRELSAVEVVEVRRKVAAARRADDKEKRTRFNSLLRSKGILRTPKKSESDSEVLDETSYMDGTAWSSQMFCSAPPPIRPKIIGMERLSNGSFLLAWEGEPARLYDVEYSDDLVNWQCGTMYLPMVSGVGTWGQFSAPAARFFRVRDTGLSSEVVGDPDGGDGVNDFGADLQINAYGTSATVILNMGEDIDSCVVELFIDGQRYGYCVGGEGIFYCSIDRERVPAGQLTAYAVVDASSGTTPGPDNETESAIIKLRSAEISFQNTYEGITGAYVTEDHILDDEIPDSPDHTDIYLEFPHGDDDPTDGTMYAFQVKDENGNVVREDHEVTMDPGPGVLSWEWDGRGDGGVSLPDGPYWIDFYMVVPGNLSLQTPILVKKGTAKTRIAAFGETSVGLSNDIAYLENLTPKWKNSIANTAGLNINGNNKWGPFGDLEHGPITMIEDLRIGIGKHPHCSFEFWVPGSVGTAHKWKNSPPASQFLVGNPLNEYDMAFLVGHGVASQGGTYQEEGIEVVLPPQHYFPIYGDRNTNETVWLKSGQMTEKFGEGGNLKWMFIVTCNYLRVASHNPGASGSLGEHDIYSPMKESGLLPISPSLHILSSYTTSCDISRELGTSFSRGAMQEDPSDPGMTLVRAWAYAWENSLNSKDKNVDGSSKQVRNARSVFWPECRGDTLPGVPHEKFTMPNGNGDQDRLEEEDSKYPSS